MAEGKTEAGLNQPEQPGVLIENQPDLCLPMMSVAGIETHMVGRDAELLMLQNMFLDTIEDAESRVVTIVGDAGVGKSRLLYEFEKWIAARPETINYYQARAVTESEAIPYGVIRHLLTDHFKILDSDGAVQVRSKFRAGMSPILNSGQADLVGQLLGLDFSESVAVQVQLGSDSFGELATAYLTEYLQATASEPTVILLEDIHWADDSSLDLLDYLVTRVHGTRLLVICLARPSLFDRRPSWGEGQKMHIQINLKPLSRRSSRVLVGDILQKARDVPIELRDMIVERAEGNPFYVEELIKMLIEDGVIILGEKQWLVELDRLAEMRIPPTLTGILRARLDGLPAAEKTILQRASVVGRLFWSAVVAELARGKIESVQVYNLLDEMRSRELILRREHSLFEATDEYIFKHALLRDVTYQTVLLRLRRLYHMQVAQWLERTAGERIHEYLSLIAQHYEIAGEKAKAVDFLRRSGDASLKISAFRDAARAFERALDLMSEADLAGRAALLVKLGNLYNRLGNYLQAEKVLEQGLTLARQTEGRQEEIEALNRLAQLASERGDYDRAQRHLDEVLALARELGDRECVASTLSMLSTIAWKWGELDQAEICCRQSLVIYQELGNKPRISLLLNILGILSTLQENFTRAEQYYEKGLQIAREIDDRQKVADLLNNAGYLNHHSIKNLSKAKRYYQESLLIAREIDHRSGATSTLINLGHLYILLGEYEIAWETLREALTETVAIGAVPLTLDALVGIAKLKFETDSQVAAAELLSLVLGHPALELDSRQLAEATLDSLRNIMPAEQLQVAIERGKKKEPEAVIDELQRVSAEFLTPE